MKVAVCIATFRRPAMLTALLDSLTGLVFQRGDAEFLVVVIDNDHEGSAREIVRAAEGRVPFPLRYALEPVPNISLARNSGVRIALEAGAEFVAFIDDDEVAEPGWLDELLRVQARYDADAVCGAVIPSYPDGVPPWVVAGRFFEAPRLRTGAVLPTASTNNVLVSQRLLREVAGPFDAAFGVAGGGDSQFFIRCHRDGARLVWAERAIVRETIPRSRTRAGWILRRAFRGGNGGVFCELSLPPHARRLGRRLLKAAGRAGLGLALLAPSALLGRRGVVKALWSICYGAGSFAALLGFRYSEYDRRHGW